MELKRDLIGTEDARRLFDELFDIRDYVSGGRWRAAFSDDPDTLTLEGSSATSKSRPWLPHVRQLRDQLAAVVQHKLNFCLINHYADGREAIKYHSDNERNSDRIIVSVSLGATRTFRVYNKATAEETDVELRSGDVLIMRGMFNSEHMHCVLPDRLCKQPRINLTFRCVHPTRVRPAPVQPFSTPRRPTRVGYDAIPRSCAQAGDIKWKNWGNVGDYIVLDEDQAAVERQKGGQFATADFYFRNLSTTALDALRPAFKRLFPRGTNFLPARCSLTQFTNILADSESAQIQRP